MPAFKDLTGKIFGNVEVNKYLGESKWECTCLSCGKTVIKTTVQAKLGGKCANCYKNSINEDYFSSINTPDKAYYLGFLWADGYCSIKHQVLKIDLQEEDKELLEKMKADWNYSGNITSYTAKLGKSYRSKESQVFRIAIKPIKFIEKVYKLGVTPHREKAPFPYDKIPEKYYKDFIRGYFDGNGSISVDCGCIDICGGTKILQDIGDILISNGFNCNYHYRRPENKDNIMLYVRGKRDERREFLDWIYKDARVYLERKYKKYLEF